MACSNTHSTVKTEQSQTSGQTNRAVRESTYCQHSEEHQPRRLHGCSEFPWRTNRLTQQPPLSSPPLVLLTVFLFLFLLFPFPCENTHWKRQMTTEGGPEIEKKIKIPQSEQAGADPDPLLLLCSDWLGNLNQQGMTDCIIGQQFGLARGRWRRRLNNVKPRWTHNLLLHDKFIIVIATGILKDICSKLFPVFFPMYLFVKSKRLKHSQTKAC